MSAIIHRTELAHLRTRAASGYSPSNATILRLLDHIEAMTAMTLAPASRSALGPDLAGGLLGAAASRGGDRAPSETSAHRVHGAQVSLSGGAGGVAPLGAVADKIR